MSGAAKTSFGIGIIGHGTVGGGVSRIALRDASRLTSVAGRPIKLTGIVTKDEPTDSEVLRDHPELFAVSLDQLLADPNTHAVVEAVGNVPFALDAMKRALTAGKHVVTANKALLAKHLPELLDAAQKGGAQLLFEAAVAGGIPVINALQSGLAGEHLHEITGILNGTSNFILSQMAEKSEDFSVALALAQQLGFAEADPTADIGGHDAAHKLRLLVALAFGADIPDFPTQGIEQIRLFDLHYAQHMGCAVRHLAHARRQENGEIIANVGPVMLPKNSQMGRVAGVLNAVHLRGDCSDSGTLLVGEGAGRFPTAAAMVSDLLRLAQSAHAPVLRLAPAILATEPPATAWYLRLLVKDQMGIVGKVCSVLGDHGISIDKIDQIAGQRPSDPVHFMVTLHPAQPSRVQAAVQEVTTLPFHAEQPLLMPLLS